MAAPCALGSGESKPGTPDGPRGMQSWSSLKHGEQSKGKPHFLQRIIGAPKAPNTRPGAVRPDAAQAAAAKLLASTSDTVGEFVSPKALHHTSHPPNMHNKLGEKTHQTKAQGSLLQPNNAPPVLGVATESMPLGRRGSWRTSELMATPICWSAPLKSSEISSSHPQITGSETASLSHPLSSQSPPPGRGYHVPQTYEEFSGLRRDSTQSSQRRRSSLVSVYSAGLEAFQAIDQEHRLAEQSGLRFPKLYQIISSRGFEVFLNVVILANCLFIGWGAGMLNPNATQQMIGSILEQIFTAVFATELLARILTSGWTWVLRSPMNRLDGFLVVLSVLTMWILQPLDLQAGVLRQLTVLRTLRLVRIAKAVSTIPMFHEMWQLIRGLTESLETLAWTAVMTTSTFYFFAIIGVTMIGNNPTWEGSQEANDNFKELMPTMWMMLQLTTLDSWTGILRPLIDFIDARADPWMHAFVMAYFVVIITTTVFVLMNLVTAVVVENAFNSSKKENEDLVRELEKSKEEEENILGEVWSILDEKGEGWLSLESFKAAANRPRVKAKLGYFQMASPKEIDELFMTADTSQGCICLDDFIIGVQKLKGEARAKDILAVMREVRVMEYSVDSIEDNTSSTLRRLDGVSSNIARMNLEIAAFSRTIKRAREAIQMVEKRQHVEPADEKRDHP